MELVITCDFAEADGCIRIICCCLSYFLCSHITALSPEIVAVDQVLNTVVVFWHLFNCELVFLFSPGFSLFLGVSSRACSSRFPLPAPTSILPLAFSY